MVVSFRKSTRNQIEIAMVAGGGGQQTDFIASLLQDGAKFLRIADDVHFLMDQMRTISSCMYALTAGVYLAIVVYVLVVCYKDRRRHQHAPDEAFTAGGTGYGGHNSLADLELGGQQQQESLDETDLMPATKPTSNTSRVRGAYRRQYSAAGAQQQDDSASAIIGTGGKPKSRMTTGGSGRRGNRFRDIVSAAAQENLQAPLHASRGASPLPLPPGQQQHGHTDFDPSAALSVV